MNLNCKISEPGSYKVYFKKRNVLKVIGLIWIWIFILNIFNMVGWIIPSGASFQGNSTADGNIKGKGNPTVH